MQPRLLKTCFGILLQIILMVALASAQDFDLTRTIRGIVIDADTRQPLPGASVVLLHHEPLIGAATDTNGRFTLPRVPLGRQSIGVSFLGYEPAVRDNILVTSGREVFLEIALREQVVMGDAIEVTADVPKDRPLNDAAMVSARSFSVEETRRYAGGVDDPARMASAFAGVTSAGGVQENALVIRGNAPKGVQWRLEGVEIPNPNHFAGMTVAGGGGLTIFSSHLLADADFMTGAFPAEYGNALSGVFDMRFRSGNTERREHAVQVGIMGIDVASEGPFRSGGRATYLFNYRYSTLALLMPLLPTDALPRYQDLAFKIEHPTGRAGRLEFWGMGGLDRQSMQENRNPEEWEYDFWDRRRFDLALGVGAGGITHHQILGSTTYLRTSMALTANRTRWDEERLDDDVVLQPNMRLRSTTGRAILGTTLNHKFSARHVNRSGMTLQRLFYDLALDAAPDRTPPPLRIAEGEGGATLLQAFTQSVLRPMSRLEATIGLHAQHFTLTGATAVEPRASVRYSLDERQALSAGYGLHSQIEDLRIYFVRRGDERPNLDIGFTRAHHAVLGYDRRLTRNSRIKTEAYVQYLFGAPVAPDSSFSMLNFEQDWTLDQALVSEGLGRNYGLELTLERFLSGGWYYLATGSLFRSEYAGGDGVWRAGRFDQRFAGNVLAGREFAIGSRGNLLGINARAILLGGKRRSPIDAAASDAARDVVFDETRPFAVRESAMAVVDLTITYRINRRRFAESWALQVKNLLAAKDATFDYNYRLGRVEEVREGFPLPALSWKIEF